MAENTHFLEEYGEVFKNSCHQNEPPFCKVACPFHLDIKDLLDKCEQGRWNAAYRSYQTAVGFPLIVSRICPEDCSKSCIMAGRGGSIQLRRLERTSIELARRTSPNAYNLPKKAGKIAIIGAGLAGLGCALRLCNKKYGVTIFETECVLGGEARGQMDPELFDQEIKNQFQHEKPDIRLNTRVSQLDDLKREYDAILIATGERGEKFDYSLTGTGAFAAGEGVFMAGRAAGAKDETQALAQGIRSAAAIERYLKTGLMNEPADEMNTMLVMNKERLPYQDAIKPAASDIFTEEEAKKEVDRCAGCSCDICMKECDLMRIQQKSPGRLYEEAYITVRPSTLANDGRWATRRIASCDQCGLCKTVCPQRIDIGDFLMKSHHGLKDTDAMPWAWHDFWLRDMDFSSSDAALAIPFKKGKKKLEYVFFPGCQLAASDPELTELIAGWLAGKQDQSGIWLNCCGAPAYWAAEDERLSEHTESLKNGWIAMGKPTLIFACPNCRRMFDQLLPEIPGIFLEEAMLMWGLPEAGLGKERFEQTFAVFDPCASRAYPRMQKAVRDILDQLKIPHRDLSHTGDMVRCCSYGGQTAIAAPDYVKRVRMERAEESPLPYITYCINCRDTFAGRGKENIHLLELAFGRRDLRRPSATFTARRANRLMVRNHLLEAYGDLCMEEEDMMNKDTFLSCSKEVEDRLSARYILLSDMEEVVSYAEKTMSGVLAPDGTITAHRKIGNMTYWAVYRPEEDGSFTLKDGYAHRMNLEGE